MFNTALFFYTLFISCLGLALVWVVYHFWKEHNRSALDSHISVKLSQRGREERRRQPRVNINWPVSIETFYGTIDAEVRNISLGGAFICCEKPLPLRKIFPLTMFGPDNEPLKATAQVVWSNANVPNEKVVNRGMGVRFIKMSDRHLQLVGQLVRESD
jgi:c-di-GMP-binding flagellar brake protein YcgR